MTISPEEEREIRANFQRFFEEEKKSWKEYEDLANMDTCPVCHSKLNPTRITSDLPLRNSSWCASYCGIKYNDLEVFMKKNGISTEKDFQDESLAFEFLLSLQRESTMSVALSKLQNTIADLD